MGRKSKNGGRNKLASGQAAASALFHQYKSGAFTRGYSFTLTKPEFLGMTKSDCHYCGSPPSREFFASKTAFGTYRCNGVDRVNNDAGYTPDNCVPCCTTCNFAKHNLTYADFVSWTERLASFVKSRAALSARFGT